MIAPSQLQVLSTEATAPRPQPHFARRPRRRLHRNADIAIRVARPRDASTIRDLEALDGRVLPDGPRLVAEADGVLIAAISVAEGTVVADPFECTVNASGLLRMRARQLRTGGAPAHASRLSLIGRLAR
jgi:hypothetical protein